MVNQAHGDELQVISDNDGVLVVGEPRLVAQFVENFGNGLETVDAHGKLETLATTGGKVAELFGSFAENSGKWLKLDEASAAALKAAGPSVSKTNGLMYGVVRAENGQILKHLQFVPTAASVMNPVMLANVGAVMSQMAMEQKLEDIEEYLKGIDKKLDRVLRELKDSLLAELDGASGVVDKAMHMRAETGRISATTWSQVQGVQKDVAKVQSRVLRRLAALADVLESDDGLKARLNNLERIQAELDDMLAALAEIFRIEDIFHVIELDRVLETEPEDLDNVRTAITSYRRDRLAKIAGVTGSLLSRIYAAGVVTNSERVTRAGQAMRLTSVSNSAIHSMTELHLALGIAADVPAHEHKTRRRAVAEIRDDSVDKARQRVDGVLEFGSGVKRDIEERYERARRQVEKHEVRRVKLEKRDGKE